MATYHHPFDGADGAGDGVFDNLLLNFCTFIRQRLVLR